MTPSMHLSAIMASYVDNPSKDQVKLDLQRAFDLGHEYGLSRAAGFIVPEGGMPRAKAGDGEK